MAEAPHPQADLLGALQPGDIIFHRPVAETFLDLDSAKFSNDFPVVAAYVQALPYMLLTGGKLWSDDAADFKPWHHVSVCVEKGSPIPKEVGFSPDTYEEVTKEARADFRAEIDRQDVNASPALSFDVLRPPAFAPGLGASIADESSQQKEAGVVYSNHGLLAFAFATKARMLPASPERERTLNLAYGTHKRARDNAPIEESCVTAVAKAIRNASGIDLSFAEPSPPGAIATLLAYQFAGTDIAKAISAILDRIEGAGKEVLISDLAGLTAHEFGRRIPSMRADVLLDRRDGDGVIPPGAVAEAGRQEFDLLLDRRIERTHMALLGAPGLGPGGGGGLPESPGPDVVTAKYLATLEVFAEHFTDPGDGGDGKTLEELGAEERATSGVPNQDHLVVSPAMLWDSLWSLGFRPVVAP